MSRTERRQVPTTDDGDEANGSGSASRLISASAVMAAGTGLSRIAGFVRAILLVAVLGAGTQQADMFSIANTVPNMLYILLAGGVLNTVFVPQVVRAMKNDADGGEAYTNRLLTVGLLGLSVITVAATLAAPLIIWVYTSNGWKSPPLTGQYDSMIFLAYLCLPQIFFYGVNVLLGQVLNSREKFGPMMFSPIANNLVSIAILVVYLLVWPREPDGAPFSRDQALLLGLGSTAGILAQAAVLVPFLRSVGFRYRPRFDFRHTGLGHTAGLAKWTLAYVVVTQLAVLVVTRIASNATVDNQGAGVLVYNNAYLLWILPHSLITVSLATAMLPSASAHAAAGDLHAVAAETTRTMRLAVTALLPAAVAFIVLAQPIVVMLFGFGRGARDAPLIGFTLVALAVGLVPFTLQYICLRAFYALEDTRTPFFIQLVIATANVVFAIVLTVPVGRPEYTAAGLGLAYSLAYVIGLFRSLSLLGTRLPRLDPAAIGRHCVRTLVAVLPAAVAAYLVSWGVSRAVPGRVGLLLSLVGAGIIAVVLFGVVARLLHLREVDQIVATLARRGGRASAGHAADDLSTGSGDSASPAAPGSPTIDPAVGARGPAGEGRADASTQVRAKAVEEVPGMTDVAESAVDTATTPFHLEQPDREQEPVSPPVPDDDTDPRDIETVIRPPTAPRLPAGTVLVGRYRLEEILAFSEPTVTWRAFDLTLSRSVLVHLLPADHEQAPGLLTSARAAAAATDSRFLRVLDAVDGRTTRPAPGRRVTDAEASSYVVCEYATGQSLQTLLVGGPLSGLEAAWITREVADAIAGVHASGLHHGRIGPDTVVITATGNIKIVGLLIEETMRPPSSHGPVGAAGPDGSTGHAEPRDLDVLDLGRLLYAMLVGRWPGGPAYGLPDTPGSELSWSTPRQVRAGVSPALDRVADQVLSRPPHHHADPIQTAVELAAALSRTLGPADASGDLERRLRQPVPKVTGTEDRSNVHVGKSGAGRTVAAGSTRATVTRSAEPDARVRQAVPARPTPAAGPGTPIPPTAPGAATVSRGRRWFTILALLIVLAAVAVIAIALGTGGLPGPARGTLGQPRTQSQAPPTASSVPPVDPIRIVSARDFDPEGQNGSGAVSREENPDEVRYAIDGDPATAWHTLTYLGSPELGNIKDGVGLVLDLGEAQVVTSVELRLTGQDTTLAVQVPRGDPARVTRPALNSVRSWATVGSASAAGRQVTITPQRPVTTRFVLVYLTSLPREGNGYQGGIAEVAIR